MNYQIKSSTLKGSITIPPSKSHTLRAILFASLATGKSVIHQYLHSPDTLAMIQACQAMGATIEMTEQQLTIIGTAGKPCTPANIIDAGNSGIVLRFIAAIAALTPNYSVITGDHSIRTNRLIQPLLSGLTQLQVFATSTQQNGFAPIIIKGPLIGGITTMDGEDSQPVSGLLIAAAFAEKNTVINVNNPGEKPWIDLTLDWFERLGIAYQRVGYTQYNIAGNTSYPGFEYTVPGDFSSCAFPLAAAIITRSQISLQNVDMNEIQGDKALIYALETMGACFEIDDTNKLLHIKQYDSLIGREINVNHFIDAVTILAVIACFAKGETIITGAAIARQKESNRLATITTELKKMGANITEHADGLIIKNSPLKAAQVDSHQDHRIAMSLAVAGLATPGTTLVTNTHCVEKSFPNFSTSLQQLGAAIEVYQ